MLLKKEAKPNQQGFSTYCSFFFFFFVKTREYKMQMQEDGF